MGFSRAAFVVVLCVLPAAATADLLYVASFGNDTVYALDPVTGVEMKSFSAPSTGSGPQGLAVSTDGRTLYVAVAGGQSNDVLVFDTLSGTQTGQFSTSLIGGDINGLALSADGSTLYASDRGGFSTAQDFVTAFDTATGAASDVVFGLSRPQGLVLAPDGQSIYVANDHSNNVVQRRLSDGAVLETFTHSTLDGPYGIDLSPDGSTLYVANTQGNIVTAFDTSTGNVDFFDTLFGPSPTGNYTGVAVNGDGSTVYVADAFNDSIIQFDISTGIGTPFSTTASLASPTYLAFAPAAVPEPGSLLLTGLAFAGAAFVSRCRRRSTEQQAP